MSDGLLYMLSYIPTPVIFLVVGVLMWRFPPKYGENVGYKTRRSRSSEQAWDTAQVYWGRAILLISIPTLVLSVIAGAVQMVFDVGEDTGFVLFCVVVTAQLLPLFVSIALTESMLKRNFDI